MCGICGIAYREQDRPIEPARLVRMRDALTHRGPDGAGLHQYKNVGLGHRRLSIIDLAGGAQPLANEDETVWVTFNGEIYNYRELTRRLENLGHRFRTHCDTEVLVHAYEQYGLSFPVQLNAMFTFALHDTARRRVVLARDHLGIKPLFYAVTDEGLFFASEIKAILAALNRPAVMNPEALQEYLTFRYTAWDRTFFEGIRRLPPGHLLVWENGAVTVQPFWEMTKGAGASPVDEAEAAEALDTLLDRAVHAQLMSDVPLGTFCSGGIDSGLVTGYAAQHTSGRLHTFSVGFSEAGWDETPLARDTATRFGTQHHTLTAGCDEFASLLSRLIWYNDEPLSDPNSVPIYLVSKLARQFVTVVLTGEGADELFCGYPRYHLARVSALAGQLPRWTRGAAGRMARSLPGRRAALLARVLPGGLEEGILYNSAYVAPELVAALSGKQIAGALDHRRALLREALDAEDPIATISRYELRTYLSCLLERMDRMSMASGLEGRVPMLDTRLVEFGLTLPSAFKIGGTTTKRILKRVAQRHLGPRVAGRRKSGFGLPLGAWFRSPAFQTVLRRLRDPDHPAAASFNHKVLVSLVDAHLDGRQDHSAALWLVLNVYLWHDVQIERVAVAAD